MTRLRYIAPEDAIRLVNPSFDSSQYDSEYDFPITEETVVTLAEGAEAEFERKARPFVETQTTEKHEGIDVNWGYKVYLDESDVLDFDPNQGDKFEIRTGPDSDDWTDFTDEVVLDNDRGIVEVRRVFIRTPTFAGISDTNQRFRVTYRHGVDGAESGATTLEQTIASGDSTPITADVADASQIPVGTTVLVNGEYFQVTARDTTSSQNTLTLATRSLRGTDAEAHASGDTVSFVVNDVRDAIASKVAYRLLQSDDYVDILSEGAQSLDREVRMEQLDSHFDDIVEKYSSGNVRYV